MRKAALLAQIRMLSSMYVSLGREAKVREGLWRISSAPTTVLSEGRMIFVRNGLPRISRYPPVYVSSEDVRAVADDRRNSRLPLKLVQV
jgi:hypothetical protein